MGSEMCIRDSLYAVSVLSGNRNFEGRINPDVKASYLASPPLVVVYALAGSMNVDLYNEPLGQDKKGKNIFLKDKKTWSGRADLNGRPLAPQASALPGCATPRHHPNTRVSRQDCGDYLLLLDTNLTRFRAIGIQNSENILELATNVRDFF